MRSIRIVHLGLGGFFRAHQAWYTGAGSDPGEWGIAAFTGRSATLADALSAQDCRYTLVVRGPSSDDLQVQKTLVSAHPGSDSATWRTLISAQSTALVTITMTEAAYAPSGVVADRLVSGLAARRLAGSGPLAVVSCDNLPGNGEVTARVVHELAARLDPALDEWITANVSFVTTMVDRITPKTTPSDVRDVESAGGWADAAPVVTEPFTEWVLSGDFPAGRPAWERAGARFVDDVVPHETRKLLLLNGGHSLLAYAGSALGHETVADAVADPVCRGWLDDWWDEACRHVPLPTGELSAYRSALLERFANPRIRHTLAQIAADGSQKIPIRVLPVLRGERAAGRLPTGAVRILAAWIDHLRGLGAPVSDAGAQPFTDRARSARDVLSLLAPDLAADDDLLKSVESTLRG
ncbi:mannitol-1-phosphate 5-dehydrogenase [Paractinoplanes abujensis]|uniref:Mannitol-1-phosphate 5-dehydrogenase n=1 Tax=Paractinoplanes abujensis TaxID=882441 RepID=A0A7W7CP27_9ACTN|nr:mannitol dehydrogenase family protein [Actinoplanes abujensis]MBB4692129.1 fructuronate reductase [Actinoplanes abujensis]GID16456.1 mannitol-1-phosphate 5-dehydrogenase [Actinoplanes abujensis]